MPVGIYEPAVKSARKEEEEEEEEEEDKEEGQDLPSHLPTRVQGANGSERLRPPLPHSLLNEARSLPVASAAAASLHPTRSMLTNNSRNPSNVRVGDGGRGRGSTSNLNLPRPHPSGRTSNTILNYGNFHTTTALPLPRSNERIIRRPRKLQTSTKTDRRNLTASQRSFMFDIRTFTEENDDDMRAAIRRLQK